MKGVSLKLNTIPKESGSSQFKQEDADVAGKVVKVVFHLPDGKKIEHEARMGNSVEQLKGWLASQVESAPYEKQHLYYKDKLMADPLSLADIPVNPAEQCVVKVEVK